MIVCTGSDADGWQSVLVDGGTFAKARQSDGIWMAHLLNLDHYEGYGETVEDAVYDAIAAILKTGASLLYLSQKAYAQLAGTWTDDAKKKAQARFEAVAPYTPVSDQLIAEINDAIDILDGNKEPIDWRDSTQPELLRKLCEHIEVFQQMQARSAAARLGWANRRAQE